MSIEPSERLLDLIYDAAADPGLWPAAMRGIAQATSSLGGILIGQRLDMRAAAFDHNGGLDPHCNVVYRAHYMNNVWSNEMIRRLPGRLVVSDDIVPLRQLRGTAFYADVLRPQGIAHNAMCAFAGTRDLIIAFNVCRTAKQGPAGERERRCIEATLPHVRRALALAHRLDGYGLLHQGHHRALDRIGAGVLLLDSDDKVVFANRAAAALIGVGGLLRLSGTRIVSRHAASNRRLGDVIAAVKRGAPLAATVLPLADGRKGLVAIASSVRSRDRSRLRQHGFGEPSVMLFLINPQADSTASGEILRDAYGLTPAEARVALAIVRGGAVADVARALAVSPNTVKTHLARIFAKTGTVGQSDLARLVTALAAVAGDDARHPNE